METSEIRLGGRLCSLKVNTYYIFMCKRKEPVYIEGHTNEEGGNNTQYTIEQEHKHIGTIMIILLFAMLFVQNPYGVRCRVERDVQTILSKLFLQNCARASKSRVKLRWPARKHVIMARATGEGRERFAREGWSGVGAVPPS